MLRKPYYVADAQTTWDEPRAGWYFVSTDADDNELIRGPFWTKAAAELVTEGESG